MKKLTAVIACGLAVASLQAQTARTFELDNSADGESKLFVALPDNPSGRAVVCCPGGGYSHLALAKEGTDWASFFNAKGIALITLKYRMPQGDLNIPLGDAYNAMRTVRDSAAVWNINPYDIGIMGSSAGGHLAATVSTHAPVDAAPNFSLLFYPVITMGNRTHEGSARNFLGDKRKDEKMIKEWSADRQVKHYMTPPALILLSNDDRVVPPVENGVAYYSAMRNTGLDCTMHIYPDGGHGWGYADYFKYKKQMLDDLSDWLDRLPSQKPNAIRVVCVGNSITHGHGIDMRSIFSYPAKLQQLLGDDYAVRNCGYSSRTLLQNGDIPYMKEEQWQVAHKSLPNVVVVKLGTNDSKPQNWGAHSEEFAHDLQMMLDTLMALPTNPRILLCTPLPAFKPSWNINEEVIANEIIPIIRNVAQRNALEIIDLHSLITDEKLLMDDGIHPNEKGCQRMAEIISEVIKSPKPELKPLMKNRNGNNRRDKRR